MAPVTKPPDELCLLKLKYGITCSFSWLVSFDVEIINFNKHIRCILNRPKLVNCLLSSKIPSGTTAKESRCAL